MPTRSSEKSVPSGRKVQGGGRPFSQARRSAAAIIKWAEVEPLVAPKGLAAEPALALATAIRRELAAYLGPKVLAQSKLDHAGSMDALARVASKSADLAKILSDLDNEYLVMLEEARSSDSNEPPPFDFLHLVPILERLGAAARRVQGKITPKRRGPATKEDLVRAVTGIVEAIERAGLDLGLINSGSATESRRRIEGPGGELLIAVFSKFDPSIELGTLWGAAKSARKILKGRRDVVRLQKAESLASGEALRSRSI